MDQARLDAARAKARTYRGIPCKNPDHRGADEKSERYVLSGGCVMCAREKAVTYKSRTQAVIRALSED